MLAYSETNAVSRYVKIFSNPLTIVLPIFRFPVILVIFDLTILYNIIGS